MTTPPLTPGAFVQLDTCTTTLASHGVIVGGVRINNYYLTTGQTLRMRQPIELPDHTFGWEYVTHVPPKGSRARQFALALLSIDAAVDADDARVVHLIGGTQAQEIIALMLNYPEFLNTQQHVTCYDVHDPEDGFATISLDGDVVTIEATSYHRFGEQTISRTTTDVLRHIFPAGREWRTAACVYARAYAETYNALAGAHAATRQTQAHERACLDAAQYVPHGISRDPAQWWALARMQRRDTCTIWGACPDAADEYAGGTAADAAR